MSLYIKWGEVFSMSSIQSIKDQFNTPEVFEVFPDCMYMPTWEKFNKHAIEYISKTTINIFGFFEDKRIVGIIVIDQPIDEIAEIRGIAVDSEYRKHGIGKQLVQHVCNELSTPVLIAETDDDAVDFYNHCGFKTEGFMKNGEYKRYKCILRTNLIKSIIKH